MTEDLPLATAAGPLDLIDSQRGLEQAAAELAAGHDAVAVDVERANGFRYSSRAYLVQVFRRGAGTFLIDPVNIDSFAPLQQAIGNVEWVLHAASQDLPSLRELGLEPARLFDTELGSRLAGFERVGLQAVVERTVGLHLKKEHSNSDWSKRPLPEAWLEYAALDVELLVDAREGVASSLSEQGKLSFAQQEFDYELRRQPKPTPAEPWRRLNGINRIKSRRQLAIAREFWLSRDAYAQEIDSAPGKLVPDAALTAVALAEPKSKGRLASLKEFHGRASRSQIDRWWAAVEAGLQSEQLPQLRLKHDGPPPPRFWEQKRPAAAARLKAARATVLELAEEWQMPQENLLTPDTLRRTIWDAPDGSAIDVAAELAARDARSWQIEITADSIAETIAVADAEVVGSVQSSDDSAEPKS